MKKIIIIVILLLASAAINQSYCQDEMMNLIKTKFNAMNKHDIKTLSGLYSDSARVESTGLQDTIYGPAQLSEVYSRYFKSTPDLNYKITRIIEAKNSVVVEYTSSGTFQNNEKGVPDYYKGKKYSLKNISCIDVRNGKIVNEATYFDQVSFLRQMGYFNSKRK